MFGRKVILLGSLVVMLASSVAGATVLRNPDATASDVTDVVEVAREELDNVQEIALDVVPSSAKGIGESLVLVVAAQVQPAEAEEKLHSLNAHFGELAGFSIDAAENYQVTGAYVPSNPEVVEVACTAELDCPDGVTTAKELQPVRLRYVGLDAVGLDEALTGVLSSDGGFVAGTTLLVTAFRTKRGAEEFVELARAADVTGLVTVQARKLGGGDVGLGQEPHPDGSGPLLAPLPDQEAYQR